MLSSQMGVSVEIDVGNGLRDCCCCWYNRRENETGREMTLEEWWEGEVLPAGTAVVEANNK